MTKQGADSPLLSPLITRLRLHSHLSDAEVHALNELPYVIVRQRQGTEIVADGQKTVPCAVLLEGFVIRSRISDDGKRQILGLYVLGDPLDLDHLYIPIADDTLEAVRDTVIAYIRHRDLDELIADHPGIGKAFIRTMLVDSSIFREWTLNVGQRNARKRIAHLFCEIALRLKAQGVDFANVPLPLTQDQIADATGLTPVHVNRTLKAFTAEDRIKRRAGFVMIPDLDRLFEIAGFDNRYLHFEP